MSEFKPNFLNKSIDRTLPTISISSVLGMIQEPFDQEAVAEKTFNKYNNDPTSQYYQKSIKEICDMWSAKGAESCKYGSLLDDYIGLNLNNQEIAHLILREVVVPIYYYENKDFFLDQVMSSNLTEMNNTLLSFSRTVDTSYLENLKYKIL